MDRNLALEFVRITEAAAIASARFMGRGDANSADQAAVNAMRKAFDRVRMDGTVVIGEGERDEAPMLYIGEKVGWNEGDVPRVDIAVDPLEGTSICANGGVGATSVIAVAEHGHFLHAPDTYMNKIAVGPAAKSKVSLKKSPSENIKIVAECLRKPVGEVTVCILDRPRHKDLIAEVRSVGARIALIQDGDVSAAISCAWPDSGIDILLGTGGAPEGVISAAAMKCLGGDFEGQLMWRNEEEKERGAKMGIKDFDRVYSMLELAAADVMFIATGVTTGPLLKGVSFLSDGRCSTHSIVMRSKTGTVRTIEAMHRLENKGWM